MGTLKGQNFRVLVFDTDAEKYKCIGMATSCTISLSANTEEASTKDDVGLSSKPQVTSKSWQIQVESLDVSDTAAMLTAIKSLTPFTLLYDEVATSDNQTPQEATYARIGQAYLSDVTFNFNDRENASKSLQFTGIGSLEPISDTIAYEAISAGSYTRGQFVRLFLGSDNNNVPSRVIASAKNLSFHVSLSLEDATTKDTDGDWVVQEPTGLSFDISTSALIRGGDTITSLTAGMDLNNVQAIYEASTPVKFQIANVSGDNNRTKGSVLVSGSVVITSLNIQGPNRQNATYDATLTGYGIYAVGA